MKLRCRTGARSWTIPGRLGMGAKGAARAADHVVLARRPEVRAHGAPVAAWIRLDRAILVRWGCGLWARNQRRAAFSSAGAVPDISAALG
ncbi:MAG: hypothetical protein KAY32_17245, partial [Candidatus Eisenbacteria sp.]|nr:hypothetical protein [Candidatus Eisenbacteria bacterium]